MKEEKMQYSRSIQWLYGVILVLLLGVSPISANAIYWTKPVISKGYDKRTEKPLHVTDTIVETDGSIWASAWIHGALPNSRIAIRWFYLDKEGKNLIYEEKIMAEGTKPILSHLNFSHVEYFPVVNYMVEFTINDQITTSAVFRVIKSTESSPESMDSYEIENKQCIQPTRTDDANIINDVINQSPSIRTMLNILDLGRVYAKDNSFSMIIPGSWQEYASKAPTTLFLKQTGTHRVNAEFLLTVIPIGAEFIMRHTPKQILETYVHELVVRLTKSSRLIKPLRSVVLEDKTIGSYMMQELVGGVKIYHFHTLQLMGKKLYDISVFVDKKEYELGKFLSTLALYSLWVKEECQKADKHLKKVSGKSASGTVLARLGRTKPEKKEDCLFPAYNVDKKIVEKVLGLYPQIKKKLNQFPIKRKIDKKNGIGFIIPSAWKIKRDPDQKTLLSFSDTIEGKKYDLDISKLSSADLGKVDKEIEEDIVMTVANMLSSRIIKQTEQKGLVTKVYVHPEVMKTDTGIFTLTILSIRQGYQQAWMGIVTFYDGEDMYLMLSTTDNPNAVYIKFFTALVAYSFKSRSSCK